MTPLFQGEIQLRRWSESSTQGVQVTFALPDSGDLEPFKAKAGKRFMAVLVEIGDDEQPVEQPEPKRAAVGPLCMLAVQWCKSPLFMSWIRQVYDRAMGGNGTGFGDIKPEHVGGAEGYARHAILVLCGIESRKELDTDPEAAERFHRLIRGPFQKHALAKGIAA